MTLPNFSDRRLKPLTENYPAGRVTTKKDEMLSNKRTKFRHVRTRYGHHCGAVAKSELIAVGIALCRSDIVQVHHKRTVTLEDIMIGLQVVEHGGERCMDLGMDRFPLVHETYRYVVLLRLYVEQVIDGQL